MINEDLHIKTKHFDIEFFTTTHSIPDSFGMAIKTPNGTIVETGDFKFDLTPIGPMANLQKMADKVAQFNQMIQNSMPTILAKPINFVMNNIVIKTLDAIKNLPTVCTSGVQRLPFSCSTAAAMPKSGI